MREYSPKLGDVVCYDGKRMVIVYIRDDCIAYPVYHYYFIEEYLLKDIIPIELNELMEKCITKMWCPNDSEEEPPFTKIDTEPYKIQQINYIKIEK